MNLVLCCFPIDVFDETQGKGRLHFSTSSFFTRERVVAGSQSYTLKQSSGGAPEIIVDILCFRSLVGKHWLDLGYTL